jgi:hypothetical protein
MITGRIIIAGYIVVLTIVVAVAAAAFVRTIEGAN